jgi:NADPH-dependent curcumin reductase CurA
MYDVVKRRLSLRGVLVTHRLDMLSTWIPLAARLLADGSLRTAETVVDGLDAAPDAFFGVLRGANVGKMLVRLG